MRGKWLVSSYNHDRVAENKCCPVTGFSTSIRKTLTHQCHTQVMGLSELEFEVLVFKLGTLQFFSIAFIA